MPASNTKTFLSVAATLLGYFAAWVVKEIEAYYQRKKLTSRIHKYELRLKKELNDPTIHPTADRKKELIESISKYHKMLEAVTFSEPQISNT